tara:strand:- start:557 stop:883 length:327 start_codon:yes stop_codon:yes gene_type:complete
MFLAWQSWITTTLGDLVQGPSEEILSLWNLTNLITIYIIGGSIMGKRARMRRRARIAAAREKSEETVVSTVKKAEEVVKAPAPVVKQVVKPTAPTSVYKKSLDTKEEK